MSTGSVEVGNKGLVTVGGTTGRAALAETTQAALPEAERPSRASVRLGKEEAEGREMTKEGERDRIAVGEEEVEGIDRTSAVLP
jgi:hypothetical protein